MSGWIKISRKYLSSKEWVSGKPFQKGQAWIDLIFLAEWSGEEIGEVNYTLKELANRWNWAKTTTSDWLNTLISEERIERFPNGKRTKYRIVNYEEYQGSKSKPRLKAKQNPNKSRSVYNKDIRTKKEEFNIYITSGAVLDDSTSESFHTKPLAYYTLSIAEWNSAETKAAAQGVPLDELPIRAKILDDWMDRGSTPAAVKARKSHTERRLFDDWVAMQVLERKTAEARAERAKTGWQPPKKEKLSEKYRREYEAEQALLKQNQENPDA